MISLFRSDFAVNKIFFQWKLTKAEEDNNQTFNKCVFEYTCTDLRPQTQPNCLHNNVKHMSHFDFHVLACISQVLKKKNQCNQYTTMLSCTLKEKNTLGLYGLIRTQAIYLTDLKSKISRKDTRISCLYLLHRYTMFQKLSYNGNLKTICVLSFSQKYLVI